MGEGQHDNPKGERSEYDLNDSIDDIPLFLRRNIKGEPMKFLSDHSQKSPFVVEGHAKPLQSLLKPDDGTLATLVTPQEFVAPDPLETNPQPSRQFGESQLNKYRRDGFVEEVMRTTQWDYVEREFVTRVQYRTWDATKQIWFIFEKDLETQSKGTSDKSSIIQRSVYYEGWGAFQGEDFLKLGCEKLIELCPYDRGSVSYSEWFEGWMSGARWFWNNELKVIDNPEIKKEEDVIIC